MNDEKAMKRKRVWFTGSVLCFAGTFLLFYAGIATVIFTELKYHYSDWISQSAAEDVLNILWAVIFICLAMALTGLILSIIKCGKKLPDGTIDLSHWYDRIFTDVLIAAASMLTFLAVPAGILFFDWFGRSVLLNRLLESYLLIDKTQINELYHQLQHTFISYEFEPRWVELIVSLLLWGLIVLFDLYVIQSLAKHFKNRRFWRDTLLFWLCQKLYIHVIRKIYRGVQKSRNLYLKTAFGFLSMIVFSLLFAAATSSFGIGYLILIITTGIVLFLGLQKYEKIRDGVRELREGNLEYKIPLSGKGELDQMAADLNEISEAQKLAIARELKNERLKTDLISNVSHDLKTPLTSMVSYLDLLEKEGLQSESAPEYLSILQEKTARLQKLTEDLFEAAKASSGTLPVNLEQINLRSLVNQAMAELEDRLKGASLEILLNEKGQKQQVLADGRLLWRVIENLLVNVSKYALTGSRVYIDILENRDRIRLEIKNISRDPLNVEPEELMERFQRGDESRNSEGSGLGLSIARDLTILMNGRFWIQIDGDLFKAIVELPAVN